MTDAASLRVVEVDGPVPGRLSILVELPATPGLTDRSIDFWVCPEHLELLPATPEVSPEIHRLR